ncbi:MAG: hypothetical protein E7483_02330 [Ruminococcaceae bacterium]|nr:hypothetical protein [Oscillospiraceae bacterium]
MKRKILASVLSLCMMISLFPTAAFAEENVQPVDETVVEETAVEEALTEETDVEAVEEAAEEIVEEATETVAEEATEEVVEETTEETVEETVTEEAANDAVTTPQGGPIHAYVDSNRIWSDTWGNAKESYVVKILDKDGNVMGTTTLNNIDGIIDGDVGVTWSIKLGATPSAGGYWTMEWITDPTVDNIPKQAALWIDGVEVSREDISYNAPDDLNKLYAATADENGKITGFCKSLEEAVAASSNVAIIRAGKYNVPAGKDLTITGAVDGVVFDDIGAKNMGGADVTFNNVTFDYYPNVNYTGLQHSGDLVYNNCTINGQVFLYGTSETFNNCTFNQNDADAYNVWTYGAKEVEFNGCTFNSAGKSVLIYSEQSDLVNDVKVTDCDFIASAPVDGKAAIEMDSSLTAGINLTIDDQTTAAGFGTGNVSGNSLWNNKKGSEGVNNDITVVVGGETVIEPEFQAKIGDTYYEKLEDALAAAVADDTVTILAGEYDKNLTVNKDITVVGETDAEGNNLVFFNGKLSVTKDGATVKNINVSNLTGNAGYIGAKDVLIEGCTVTGSNGFRSCYTSGKVTFKDSTIRGGVYGIHFDGSAGGEIVIDNCTIEGWTSFAASIKKITISDSEFEKGNYNQLRFYQDVEIVNTEFNPDMTIDFGKNDVSMDVEDCKVVDEQGNETGKMTDVIYLPDIVDMGVEVTVDDETVNVFKVETEEGTDYYTSVEEAMEAKGEDEATVTFGGDMVAEEAIVVEGETEFAVGDNDVTAIVELTDGASLKVIVDEANGGSANFTVITNVPNKVVSYDATTGVYSLTDCQHVNTKVLPGKAATCTEDGVTAGEYCEDCNTVTVEQQTIPAAGHRFGGWYTTKEATCCAAGVEAHVCTVCNHGVSRSIAATGHHFDINGVCAGCGFTEAQVKASTPSRVNPNTGVHF